VSTSQRAVTPCGWGVKVVYDSCVGGRWNCVIPLWHTDHGWAL